MDCTQVSEYISMYIEDEVSEEIRDQMTQHFEQCATCRELKTKVEEMLYAFPELEEEVPFFLKNRLCYIPESQRIEEMPESRFFYLRWVAAVVGPLIILLNILYFTPIYPPANRLLHTAVSKIETLTVEAGALFERLKESGSIFGFSSNGDKKEINDRKKQETKAGQKEKTTVPNQKKEK